MARGNPIEERLRSLDRARKVVCMDELTVIRDARAAGKTWREIGDAIGMTESATRKRYVAKGIN